jgi:single-strand DNA-binding protein
MANLNKVLLIGNLTRDPELRYTPQGKAVVTLRLAVNTNFKSQNGEKKQETCYINVIAWGNLAETCNQYLQKGRPVFAEGRLQSRTWQDQDGKNRSSIEVRAERIQFLGTRGQAGAAGGDMVDEPAMSGQAGYSEGEDLVMIPEEEIF